MLDYTTQETQVWFQVEAPSTGHLSHPQAVLQTSSPVFFFFFSELNGTQQILSSSFLCARPWAEHQRPRVKSSLNPALK